MKLFEITGGIKRQSETIDKLEWVTNVPIKELETFLLKTNIQQKKHLPAAHHSAHLKIY